MFEQHIYKPGIMYHCETYLTKQLTEIPCSDSRNIKIENQHANMVVTIKMKKKNEWKYTAPVLFRPTTMEIYNTGILHPPRTHAQSETLL